MNKRQAKELFDKYVKDQCSAKEIEMLNKYLQSFQDKDKLWSELRYDEEIKGKIWMNIKSNINTKSQESKFALKHYFKYAAIIVGLIGSFFWYQNSSKEFLPESKQVVESEIILKTSDNTLKKIDSNSEQDLFDSRGKVIGKQNGNQISYVGNDGIQELVYNEIIVPNGKKIEIKLSDGSLVHMNSGSTLKYPVNFISGKDRQVFLNGEAYFEVTKDPLSHFLVSTDSLDVEVLGTHFNVSSYSGTETFALLAEGSVAVYNKKDKDLPGSPTIIRPGEKATLSQNSIEVNEVNVNDYLSWREGRLTFNNESFINIVQKIERHFAVEIENNYKDLNLVKFNGEFREGETIIDILNTIQESAGFEYEINNKKIKINRMKEK
ncbi:FecR domain-containing protein [Maribacter polysiphoniae]|uniref:FecR domain-containing protein n=1 Tax=Maribacter polysiphoniae TaxID=429344 RepID=A0A316EI01_9FLAO|nr:FecR family protein [Maribacter polysiphoniae]MBD1261647.1 FecR domain-containing protein [Maribacter polysiphoniae]PWK22550.1 FecR family protein [Maribacter polysiphoniae]